MRTRDSHPFTLTPSAWDALDRLCSAYAVTTAPAPRKGSNKGVRA